MSKLIQIRCKDLEPGNIIRSGKEGYVVKEIEVVGHHLEISLIGANEIIKASPSQKIYVEKQDDFFDFDDDPTPHTPTGWSDDQSTYTTPDGIVHTEEEIMNAAYDGADFSIGNSYPR